MSVSNSIDYFDNNNIFLMFIFNIYHTYLRTTIYLFRAKLAIMDTLIFQDGAPFMWLFTSDKTGVITLYYTCLKCTIMQ